MTYIVPQKWQCPKCGFEMAYSPSITYMFLPVSRPDEHPFCYACLIEWIKSNVPIMEVPIMERKP